MMTGTSPFLLDLAIVGAPILAIGLIVIRAHFRRRRRPQTLAERYDDDKGEALTIFYRSPRP